MLKAAKLGEIFILFYYFGWGKGTVFPWQGQILTGKTLQRLALNRETLAASPAAYPEGHPKKWQDHVVAFISWWQFKSHFCLGRDSASGPESVRCWYPGTEGLERNLPLGHRGVCPRRCYPGEDPVSDSGLASCPQRVPPLGGETVP